MKLETIGWSVLFGGGAATLLAWTGSAAHARNERALEELSSRVAHLAEALPAEPDGDAPAFADPAPALQRLEERIRRLESAASRTPLGAAQADATSADATAAARSDRSGAGPAGEPDVATRDEFDALLRELDANDWDYERLGESYERFLELARESGLLDERIAELESAVAAAPADVDLRMDLADTFIAKLMTASGPEQGLWGNRATEQWQAVVDLRPDHLGAHASLGVSYSYYPDVMGKTDDAIRHLERARALQRDVQPNPRHVQIFVFLARLYRRNGRVDDARATLLEGLQAHPGNEQLEAALEQLG